MALYVEVDYWIAGYAEGDDGVVAAPYPGPAGGVSRQRGRQKRKKFVIDGEVVLATREELEARLEAMLEATPAPDEVRPAKVAAKDRAIVAQFPAYPDIRDMLLAAQQIEAAQALRAVAQRLADEEDERDVEMLLLWG